MCNDWFDLSACDIRALKLTTGSALLLIFCMKDFSTSSYIHSSLCIVYSIPGA